MAARTIFTNKTIFASLLAIGIAGTAQAQAPSSLNIAGRAPAQAQLEHRLFAKSLI